MAQQQENNVEPCKIFVGGLDHNTNEEILQTYFGNYGEVKEASIMRDSSTGFSRGFGFVTFKQQAPVDQVVTVNDASGHSLNGKKIDAKRATMKSAKQSACKVFVGGLPQCEANELKEFFEGSGYPVTSVEVKYNKETHACRGFGFVELENQADLIKLKGEKFLNFGNKRIEIKEARPHGSSQTRQQQQQLAQHQSQVYPQNSAMYDQKVYPSSQFHSFPHDYPPVYPSQQTQQQSSYYTGQYQQSYHQYYSGGSGYDQQPQQQHDHSYVQQQQQQHQQQQQQQHHHSQQMPASAAAAAAAPAPPSQGQQQMSYQSAPSYAVSNGRAAAPPHAYTGNMSSSYSSFNYQQQDSSGHGTQDAAAATSMTAYPNYDQQAVAANSYSQMGVHPPRQPTM